jgi:hypothetical protein
MYSFGTNPTPRCGREAITTNVCLEDAVNDFRNADPALRSTPEDHHPNSNTKQPQFGPAVATTIQRPELVIESKSLTAPVSGPRG